MQPQLRFFELESRDSAQRYQIDVRSADQFFVVDLPPGRYQLTRIKISEGPFMSMADVGMMFLVVPESITPVGTWEIGIESSQYGRKLVMSVSAEQDKAGRIRGFISEPYSSAHERTMVEHLPHPSQIEARLYETMP